MLLTSGAPSRAYDCYVVGSGPAGLTLALELAKASKSVLVFESGSADNARTDVPTTLNLGHFAHGWWDHHSVRVLGGTSRVWAGWCATLTERDLNHPTGVRWPIDRATLVPYYRRAATLLDRDVSIVDFEAPSLSGFRYRPFSVAAPTRFGLKYRDVLEKSSAIDVALDCSMVGLDATASRTVVRTLTYYHHPSGLARDIALTPTQTVVVAGGGIGNARLLLQPRSDGTVSVGNESGHAGKFLMEHPHFNRAAEIVLDEDLDRQPRPAAFGTPVHALVPDDGLSNRHDLLACSVDCHDKRLDHPMVDYLVGRHRRPFYSYTSTVRSEMAPAASNRVFLTGERDVSGVYRPGVRCVIGTDAFLTAETTLRLLGESLIESGKGRVRFYNHRLYQQPTGGGHIMGTTRMGTSQSTSVVDCNCQVHGYRNLFVAGSSLFPTGGYANPTLTIVALSLRLADRLAAMS